MARYYFDIDDGEMSVHDEDGTELEDLTKVTHEAASILAEMAKARLPGSEHRDVIIEVRGESGPVLRALQSFSIELLT